jgi:hypothetical protein
MLWNSSASRRARGLKAEEIPFPVPIPQGEARRGGQRAVLAIAPAELIAIYWALRNGTPYPEQVQRMQQDRREAQIRYHLQRLTKLGYEPDMHG